MNARQPFSRRLFLTMAVGLGLVAAACGAPASAPTAAPTAAPAPAAGKPPEPTAAPAAAGATPASAASGAKVKLSISHIGGGSQAGSDQSDRMKQLRTAFPNVEIENRWISYAAYVEKISLMTSTGDLADLQFCNAFNDVPLMMENNLLLETGPLLQQHGKAILAATPKDAWDSTLYEGKQYAVAHNIYDLNIWMLMYRKDWLEKAGLKVPETLDEYAGALRAFAKEKTSTGKPVFGRALFNSIKFDDDIFHAFDVAVGHHANGFWRERGGKLELDWVQPGMKEAWGWLRQRWTEKVFEPDSITQQITYKGQVWNAGVIGSQYGAWTAIDSGQLEVRKTDPKAELIAGPAPKGPNGASGYTGEGFPWVFVIPKKSQVAEQAVKMVDWFFQPPQVGRFVCDGELGYTLKPLNEKGYCVEYTTQEKIAQGAEWNDKVNKAQDIAVFGGVWTPILGNSIRPWLLDTLPPDMKAHFEGIMKGRYSPAALQGMDFAMKSVKTTKKKRPTKSEKQYWPAMQTRFLEIMTQVVAGTLPLEQGWTDWQAFFQKSGGPTLTQEVNDLK